MVKLFTDSLGTVLKITSNMHPVAIMQFTDLSDKQQEDALEDFDYMTDDEIENSMFFMVQGSLHTQDTILCCNSAWTSTEVELVNTLENITKYEYAIGYIDNGYYRTYIAQDFGCEYFIVFNVKVID